MADLQAFKDAMSQMATGVTLVTTFDQGTSFGMTVSSFTSVSDSPPMVSICLTKTVATCAAIERTRRFAVNVLKYEHVALGKLFADPHVDMRQRFEEAQWAMSQTQNPILSGALAWFDCQVVAQLDVGDHFIWVGEVLQSGSEKQGTPSLYYHRQWRRVEG